MWLLRQIGAVDQCSSWGLDLITFAKESLKLLICIVVQIHVSGSVTWKLLLVTWVTQVLLAVIVVGCDSCLHNILWCKQSLITEKCSKYHNILFLQYFAMNQHMSTYSPYYWEFRYKALYLLDESKDLFQTCSKPLKHPACFNFLLFFFFFFFF